MKLTNTQKSVAQILKLHGEILDAARTSLPKAIQIGELLTGIKDKMDHGQWLPWIQKNLSFSDRTAARYIKCFSERERLGKFDSLSNLTEAYELLSEPKTEPAPLLSAAARIARAKELDSQISQSLAGIQSTDTDFADDELPVGYLDFTGLPDFFKSRGRSFGIQLTNEDQTGFGVLEFYLANGAVASRETIRKILAAFNPARRNGAAT